MKPGDLCIDATAGNGHDTLFLAQSVAPDGMVYAIDIQRRLSAIPRKIEKKHELSYLLQPIHGSHSEVESFLNNDLKGKFASAMFNLGYLPGGSREIITRPHSPYPPSRKLSSLSSLMALLQYCVIGAMTGGKETEEVQNLCLKDQLDPTHEVVEGNKLRLTSHPSSPSVLILIRKIGSFALTMKIRINRKHKEEQLNSRS